MPKVSVIIPGCNVAPYFSPDLLVAAKEVMSKEEYDDLCKVLVYPLGEKIVNGFRCLREHGFRYTLRRILFGRQEKE